MGYQFTDVCFITNDILRLRAFYEAIFDVKAEGNEIHSGISEERPCRRLRTVRRAPFAR